MTKPPNLVHHILSLSLAVSCDLYIWIKRFSTLFHQRQTPTGQSAGHWQKHRTGNSFSQFNVSPLEIGYQWQHLLTWINFNPSMVKFNCKSRNRHRNIWDRQCVSSRCPVDCFRTVNWNMLFFISVADGVCHLFYLYWLMGKGMAYDSLPFSETGFPISDVANIYLIWNV